MDWWFRVPCDGGATESFTANTTPVIDQTHMVLPSRRGAARMESIAGAIFHSLYWCYCIEMLSYHVTLVLHSQKITVFVANSGVLKYIKKYSILGADYYYYYFINPTNKLSQLYKFSVIRAHDFK